MDMVGRKNLNSWFNSQQHITILTWTQYQVCSKGTPEQGIDKANRE